MSSAGPTFIDFEHITELRTDLVQRAAAFTAAVALLNRNRNHLGEVHAPVVLVTDQLDRVKETRLSCTFYKNQSELLGTCWNGSSYHGGTLIWLNHVNHISPTVQMVRTRPGLVETLTHELAHAHTRGKHGWTFRRMYALVAPHIFPLFGEQWTADHLVNLIRRYQSDNLSERGVSSAAYEVFSCFERRYEEVEKHLIAAKRLVKRLRKLGITP